MICESFLQARLLVGRSLVRRAPVRIQLPAFARAGVRSQIIFKGSPEKKRARRYCPGLLLCPDGTGCAPHGSLLGVVPRLDPFQLMGCALKVLQPSLIQGWSIMAGDARVLEKSMLLSYTAIHRQHAQEEGEHSEPQNLEAVAALLKMAWNECPMGCDPEMECAASHCREAHVREVVQRLIELAASEK